MPTAAPSPASSPASSPATEAAPARALRYLALAQWLEDGLRAGRWDARTPLPSERELASRHAVSRVTARKALDTLVAQGLVQRRHGSGSFAVPRLRDDLRALASFSDALRARGHTPASHWLRRERRGASAEEALALRLPAGAAVAVLERVRLADGLPMALECAVLPAAVLGDPVALGDSLYAHLRARGQPVRRAQQRIRAVNASPQQAALLGQPSGQALLWVTRTGLGGDDRPLEWTQSWLLSSHWDFVTDLFPAATP